MKSRLRWPATSLIFPASLLFESMIPSLFTGKKLFDK